jgi:hypothetical protein
MKPNSHRPEPVDVQPPEVGGFFAHPTFEQIAQHQGVEPLRDPGQLAGGFPDEVDIEEMLDEIYRTR